MHDKPDTPVRVDFTMYRGDTYTRLFLPFYKLADDTGVIHLNASVS